MSKEKPTKAVLTNDGTVLIEQPDGSYRRAEGKTDWKQLSGMSDEQLDYSEIPEIDEAFWTKADLRLPETKERITIRLDHDVLAWLKQQGKGYQTRINAILRQYMDSYKHPE